MTSERLVSPNWRTGFDIFVTRSLSLVVALILVVIVCVSSFMLLTFPAIAGYYHAVRHSKREEYFIDLPNVFRTNSLVLKGMAVHFIPSYIVGVVGLLPAVLLFLAPVLPWSIVGDEWMYASLPLMLLWVPAFFLMGITVFSAYPRLIATNNAIESLRYAISAGKARPLLAFVRGFLLLYPIPGWIIHFTMVLSYPFIVAWAVSTTNDIEEEQLEVDGRRPDLLVGVLATLVLAFVLVGFCYLFVELWEIAGFAVWLVLSLIIVFLWARRFNK